MGRIGAASVGAGALWADTMPLELSAQTGFLTFFFPGIVLLSLFEKTVGSVLIRSISIRLARRRAIA